MLPEEKEGKTTEEEVSAEFEEKEKTEKTDEGEEGKEEEADRLLAQSVKVPTSQGKEREMSVKDVISRYGSLEAEFTKDRQILKDPERLKAYFKSEFGADLSEEETETKTQDDLEDEDKQTLEEGKRLGFINKDELIQEKKLWKEELKLEMTLESLEDEFDGSDGRPRFDKYEIAQYMQEEGFRDPQKAYKDKYEPELKEWGKKEEGGTKTTFSEKPTSGSVKLPPGKSMGKLTDNEARDVMTSMLEGK